MFACLRASIHGCLLAGTGRLWYAIAGMTEHVSLHCKHFSVLKVFVPRRGKYFTGGGTDLEHVS